MSIINESRERNTVRVRISLLGSNMWYAYRKNQSVAINNDLWRYNKIMDDTRQSVLNRFTVTELMAVRVAVRGNLYKESKLGIEKLISKQPDEALGNVNKESLVAKIARLSYIEQCALLKIVEQSEGEE